MVARARAAAALASGTNAVSPWTLRFADPALEALYARHWAARCASLHDPQGAGDKPAEKK